MPQLEVLNTLPLSCLQHPWHWGPLARRAAITSSPPALQQANRQDCTAQQKTPAENPASTQLRLRVPITQQQKPLHASMQSAASALPNAPLSVAAATAKSSSAAPKNALPARIKAFRSRLRMTQRLRLSWDGSTLTGS